MNQAEADMIILFILLLAVFQVTVSSYLIENPDYYQLDADGRRGTVPGPRYAYDSDGRA